MAKYDARLKQIEKKVPPAKIDFKIIRVYYNPDGSIAHEENEARGKHGKV